MAKGSKRGTRGHTYRPLTSLRSSMVTRPLTAYEDRRLFQPKKMVDSAMSFGHPSRVVFKPHKRVAPKTKSNVSGRGRLKKLISSFSFHVPKKTLICVRRKQRKQVLHALRKSGKGGQRKPRRNTYSSIRC